MQKRLLFTKTLNRYFYRIICSFVLFANILSGLSSQTYIEVLSVNAGGSPVFIFDNLNEFSTGLTYSNFIRIGVRFEYRDNTNALTSDTWKLSVGASTPDLSGTTGSIPLDRIELRVVSITLGQATVSLGAGAFFPLTALYREILQAGVNDIITAEVVLDIRAGVPPSSLIGYSPDYYLGFIDFFLDHE
jgi:hypothetical protein